MQWTYRSIYSCNSSSSTGFKSHIVTAGKGTSQLWKSVSKPIENNTIVYRQLFSVLKCNNLRLTGNSRVSLEFLPQSDNDDAGCNGSYSSEAEPHKSGHSK